MPETRELHDPFLNKTVEISNRLTDRLRGRYANGPTTPSGEPEFGWREFDVPPIQKEAAAEIARLTAVLKGIAEYCSGDDRTLGAIERLVSIRNTAEQATR